MKVARGFQRQWNMRLSTELGPYIYWPSKTREYSGMSKSQASSAQFSLISFDLKLNSFELEAKLKVWLAQLSSAYVYAPT